MQKANAIVIYDGKTNQLYNLTVNHKGNNITLVSYENEKTVKPYKYENFQLLYKSILQIAKNNNFYFSKYNQFGAVFYDVSWIDINNPAGIKKYGYLLK